MKKALLVFVILHAVSMLAHAQSRNPGRDLESRVNYLERTVYDLNQRLQRLEGGGGRPAPYTEVSCMATADTYYGVFFGKARTRIEAETIALQACSASHNPIFCKKTVCDDQNPSYINGAVCTVTSSTYNTIHKGEGKSLLEAEYKARKDCQSKHHANFCNNGPQARCETF
ncbi:hypothetical protein D3C87_109830 [compost metagenome]